MPKLGRVGTLRSLAAASKKQRVALRRGHPQSEVTKDAAGATAAAFDLITRGKEPENFSHDDNQQHQPKQHQPKGKAVNHHATADILDIPKQEQSRSVNRNPMPEDSASAAAKKAEGMEVSTVESSFLSRGQRKRMAKREQYMRREQMVLSSLQLQQDTQLQKKQQRRIDGMEAIKAALLQTVQQGVDGHLSAKKSKTASSANEEEEKPPSLLKSNKGRQVLVKKEVTQMNLVLQHPAFQANPFATIRQHLQNTIASDRVLQQQQEQQHVVDRQQQDKLKTKQTTKKKSKRRKFKATRSKSR